MENSQRASDDLEAEIGAYFGGAPRPEELKSALRTATLLVPATARNGIPRIDHRGLSWIPAFTDETRLVSWLRIKPGDTAVTGYREVTGAKLLDGYLPAMPGPTGLAVNIAGPRPMLFPPLRRVVPDSAAIDQPHHDEDLPATDGERFLDDLLEEHRDD